MSETSVKATILSQARRRAWLTPLIVGLGLGLFFLVGWLIGITRVLFIDYERE